MAKCKAYGISGERVNNRLTFSVLNSLSKC